MAADAPSAPSARMFSSVPFDREAGGKEGGHNHEANLLDLEIARVVGEISVVAADIKTAQKQIEAVEAQLLHAIDPAEKQYLRENKNKLQEKENKLQEKENKLIDQRSQIMKARAPSGPADVIEGR